MMRSDPTRSLVYIMIMETLIIIAKEKSNFILYNPWYEVCLIRSCENIGNSLQPFLYVFLLLFFIYRRNGLNRRKIRLKEGNANCRHLNNLEASPPGFLYGVVKQFCD
jgi:hypothetical protein